MCQGVLLNLDVLGGAPDRNDLHDFVEGVWQQSDDKETVEQIDWDTVSRLHFSASDLTNTSVGGEHHDWSEITLECSVHVGEALDVEHVDLIDEEDTWHELSDAVVNILVDDFVDFESKLLCDLSLLRSIDLTHQRQEVVTTLWPCIRHIKVMKSDILHNFLLLMDVTLGNRNILLSFKIILRCVRVRSSYPLDSSTSSLDINDISDSNLLLLNIFINTWIKFQLLLTFCSLETNYD